MRGGIRRAWLAPLAGAFAVAVLAAPGSALAAEHCEEPGAGDWTDVTPADAGMDAAKLEAAIDYATANNAEAVRIIRYGCRVASDRLAPVNSGLQFQSWSLAKSITALVFGRAMTQHLVGPDDPLGRSDSARRCRPRRDHDARPADDDQRALLERPARLQHHHAGPDLRGAHGAGRQEAGDLLGVLAERARPGRRGDRERDRHGLPGVRPRAAHRGRSASRTAPGAGSATRPATPRASSACT